MSVTVNGRNKPAAATADGKPKERAAAAERGGGGGAAEVAAPAAAGGRVGGRGVSGRVVGGVGVHLDQHRPGGGGGPGRVCSGVR